MRYCTGKTFIRKVPTGFIFVSSCSFIPCFVLTGLLCMSSILLTAQQSNTQLLTSKDLGDIMAQLFHKKPDTTVKVSQTSISALPSLGYNPSYGFVFGAKASIIKQYGEASNTDLSAFGLEAFYATKGITSVQARHNVFTEGNKWILLGNWQISKFVIDDYGISTGNKTAITHRDSSYKLTFQFIRLTEIVYRRIGKHLFAGGGISFDMRAKIEDERFDSLGTSPHYRYSTRNGFDPKKYFSNGLIIAMQYNSREHPLRAYGGAYADVSFRFNPTWLGSSKKSVQFIYDLRKYFSLSKKNPEHVLAFWHTASYRVSGTIPYLEMPATAYDTYGRGGRAYTMGRFKGPSYAYFEGEWRFPILRNKFISGVIFANTQTAGDDLKRSVFEYWEPAAGAGLRVLFDKVGRSTICIDYARGKYNSSGLFFFALNEVF
jgi:hypothetical protein